MTRHIAASLLRRASFGLLAAAGLLAAGCATSREVRLFAEECEIEGDGGPLPIRWVGSLAFADVSIDGRAPRPFLLDTGASVMAISARTADALRLPRVRLSGDAAGLPIEAAHGLSATASEVSPLAEVRSGPLVLRRIDAVVLGTDLIDGAMGFPVDGVLPAGALRGLVVTFDFPGRSVTVGRGELPADAADVLALAPHSLPTITFDVGGSSFPVLLDTGSNEFLSIPESAAASAAFRSPPVETGRYATAGGMATRREGRLAGTLTLGTHPLEAPVVSLQPTDRGGIGVELMLNFRVTFDLAHDRVRFERSGTEPIRTPPVRGLGAGISRGADGPSVAYVLDGSPAASAGVRVGDRVETIEGLPAAQVSATMVEILVRTSPAIRIGVADPATGTRRELTVPVVTFVE